MAELVNKIHEQKFDNLIGGTTIPFFTKNITIIAGSGNLLKGTILGKITPGGKYRKVDKTKTDGSQIADMILAETINVGDTDVIVRAYSQGLFNRSALIVSDGDDVVTHEDELRKVNIILTEVR